MKGGRWGVSHCEVDIRTVNANGCFDNWGPVTRALLVEDGIRANFQIRSTHGFDARSHSSDVGLLLCYCVLSLC